MTLLVRNKTALVDEFTYIKFIVIPKMNCKIPFSSSVKIASMLPFTMAQTVEGGNSSVTAMRIFVANFLIFRSSELSVNTNNVLIDDIVFICRTATRMIKEISHNTTNI